MYEPFRVIGCTRRGVSFLSFRQSRIGSNFMEICNLVPIALFTSLSQQGLGTRNEGLWRQRFPVVDSRTSGLHVCSRDVSIDCMGDFARDFFGSNGQ